MKLPLLSEILEGFLELLISGVLEILSHTHVLIKADVKQVLETIFMC